MYRHVLAAAIAVCLMPASVVAQTTVLTITAAREDVRKSPSVASPAVGQAAQGRVLEVAREVGDWVKVSWPDAPDGIGYVRLRGGVLSRSGDPAPTRVEGASATRSAAEDDSRDPMAVRADPETVERQIRARAPASQYVVPTTHTMGLGGLLNGSTIGFGGSGRVWSRRRLGAQIEVSRYSLAIRSTADRVTSVHFAPSILFSMADVLTDYVRFRPYVGGGARLSRSALHTAGSERVSESRRSWQILGGAEASLASAPRFALSADLRHDSSRTPFAGFTFGGVGFSAAGHWYFR